MAAMPPHAGQPVIAAGTPLDRAQAAMIMLHGRGAAPRNILDFVPLLDRPGFAYLAPAAADGTWYPHSFLVDIEKNEPRLSSGISMLDHLVADIESGGMAKSRIVLLGFSQGACLASEFAARHPARYGGLIAFSGGVVGPPGTPRNYPGSFDGMPAFFGCSDIDSFIPRDRVTESAAVYERMGARVTARLYPGMGHEVNDDEIAFARELMDSVLSAGDHD